MITTIWFIVVFIAFAIGGAMGMLTMKEQLRRSGYIVMRRKDGTYYICDIREELKELEKTND